MVFILQATFSNVETGSILLQIYPKTVPWLQLTTSPEPILTQAFIWHEYAARVNAHMAHGAAVMKR